MMSQKKVITNWIIISLSIFSLLGCSKNAEDISTSSQVAIPDATEVAIHPTIPGTSSDSNEIDYRCATFKKDITELGNITGTIILNGYIVVLRDKAKEISNPLLLINLNTGNEIQLSVMETDNHFAVSPSGDYLAYDVWKDGTNQWQINIVDATGNQLRTFDEEDLQSFEWLDRDNLFINSLSNKLEHSPLILLSPFGNNEKLIEPFITEEERIIPSDRELIYGWGFYAFHKIIYNSTFTRAIYASSDENGATIVFRDLLSNKDISTLRSREAWGISPKWSPDGAQIAIGMNINSADGKNEIVVVNQNGALIFTTHLAELYEKSYISSLSWSPDGKKIAFWYTVNENINSALRLAILDTSTQKITDFCTSKDSPYYRWHTNDKSPIWSPDSNYLLIETANDDIPNAVILDISNGNAVIIKNSYEPAGWMK
jgi:Tol biopolymer transport system component